MRSRLPSSTGSTFSGASTDRRCVAVRRDSMGRPAASGRARSSSSASTSLTQVSSTGSPVCDSRASSRKALVSSSMSRVARTIRATDRRLASLSPASVSSMPAASWITVSGLRSSWLASRVKSRSRATNSLRRWA